MRRGEISQKLPKKLPIGTSGFRKLRERNYHYVDKTLFVREVLDAPEEVLLIPRPRRFGKTLNLSMLVWLSHTYNIRSNRESGLGRYDLMLRPKDSGKQGIIIEFKRLEDEEDKDGDAEKKKKKKTPEKALEEALGQIGEKGYTEELEAAGIRKTLKLAIVFRGKELWVGAIDV